MDVDVGVEDTEVAGSLGDTALLIAFPRKEIPVSPEEDKIVFRPIQREDIDLLVKLEREIYFGKEVLGTDFMTAVVDSEEALTVDSNQGSFIVYREEAPIGYCLMVPMESTIAEEQVMHILDMAITPEYQRKGYGSRVLEKVLSIAAVQGLSIEAEAKETTSYRFLTGEKGQNCIAEAGYSLTHDVVMRKYSGRDDYHYVRLESKDRKITLEGEYPGLEMLRYLPNVRVCEIRRLDEGRILIKTISSDLVVEAVLRPLLFEEMTLLADIEDSDTADLSELKEMYRQCLKPLSIQVSCPDKPEGTPIDLVAELADYPPTVNTYQAPEMLRVAEAIGRVSDLTIRYLCMKQLQHFGASGTMDIPFPVDCLDIQTIGHELGHAKEPMGEYGDEQRSVADDVRQKERSADAAGLLFLRGLATRLGLDVALAIRYSGYGLHAYAQGYGTEATEPFVRSNTVYDKQIREAQEIMNQIVNKVMSKK